MKLYGLIGKPLGHSLSPFIHREIGKLRSLNINYQLFEVSKENLGTAIKGLQALGAVGVNVTIPYKTDVMSFVDIISPEASRIGSVNTLCISEKMIEAYNTDYYGFIKSLKKNNAPVTGKRVMLLGTGGAARSACLALEDMGASEIVVVSRDETQKKFIVGSSEFKVVNYNSDSFKREWDLLVNTTPVGMHPNIHNCPVDSAFVGQCGFVFDIIYNPVQTSLLESASRRNIPSCNGMLMLVEQAAEAQKLWNSITLTDYELDDICFSLTKAI